MKTHRIASLVAALSLLGFVAGVHDADDALDAVIPTVNFDATPLSDAIDFIRDAAHVSIQVDWKTLEAAGIDKSTPVSFKLRSISARKALDTVLREVGAGSKLAYEIDENVIEVTTQDEADKKLVTEVYDIRDLMFTPLDAGQPPQIQFQLTAVQRGGGGGDGGNMFGGGSSGGNQNNDKTPEQKGAELVDIIQNLIRPEIWQAQGGPASIRYFNYCLIISAPRSVHDLIGTPVKP
jgi:hypothetical protein